MAKFLVGSLFALSILCWSAPVQAIPAFAAQTGQPCNACHIGGFGPQLTPFGRTFKLEGYTMRAGADFVAPVSAMAVASYVTSSKNQPAPPADSFGINDNLALDQVSVFVAGGIGDHFGGFTQWTYDGVGRAFAWDNLDLRAVDHVTLAYHDVLLGVTLNNAPAVEDVWNTLPAWGFPYTDSDLAPAPAAGTLFDGAFAQTTLGTTFYANWDFGLYTEAGFYWTPSNHFLSALGADFGPGPIKGVAPYLRVAYQKDYETQNFEVGAFGFFPDLHPGGDNSTGRIDSYTDLGLDGSYQFTGDGTNIYTVNARYTHEDQDLAATRILGGAASNTVRLDDLRLDASYYWHNTVGGSVQLFDTWGSRDALLYADNAALKPDSSGIKFQLDGTPWGAGDSPLGPRFNLRVGLQYTIYTKFDGASHNYDGLGRDASDNDSLRIFTWLAI